MKLFSGITIGLPLGFIAYFFKDSLISEENTIIFSTITIFIFLLEGIIQGIVDMLFSFLALLSTVYITPLLIIFLPVCIGYSLILYFQITNIEDQESEYNDYF